MFESLMPWIHFLGRVMFAMLFVGLGTMHLAKPSEFTTKARSNGAPGAKAMTVLTGLMMLVGGVLLVLGARRFVAAGLLAISLVPIAFLRHDFWNETDPAQRESQMGHFAKNIALAGAALVLASFAGSDEWPMALPQLFR